jgi:hypothetical protein
MAAALNLGDVKQLQQRWLLPQGFDDEQSLERKDRSYNGQ